MELKDQIASLFCGRIRYAMERAEPKYECLQEIRMRLHQPIIFRTGKEELFLEEQGILGNDMKNAIRPERRELQSILETACGYSGYAFEEEIRKGYITCHGGHRIGVVGQAVVEKGCVKTLKNITALNIRIAHDVRGCVGKWKHYFYQDEKPCHMLIISPPGWGKTTVLRDVIRMYSEGDRMYVPVTVGVVDERSELGGSYRGEAEHFLGIRTDLLDGCPKNIGMEMLLRSMAPQVIAVDEIGETDVRSICEALHCGCKILASLHGERVEDFIEKSCFREIVKEELFERYIFLKSRETPGVIGKIYDQKFRVIWEDGQCT